MDSKSGAGRGPTPKFASFKPKTTPQIASNDEISKEQEAREDKHRKETKDKSKHKHRSRHENRSRSRSRERKRHHHDSNKSRHNSSVQSIQPEVDESVLTSQLFRVDRKGDQGIISYGSLHRGDVPNYRRTGFGRVLGLPTDQRIDLENSSEKALHITGGSYKSKQNERSVLSSIPLLQDREFRLVLPHRKAEVKDPTPKTNQATQDDTELEFLALGANKPKKAPSPVPAREVDYRSIEGKAKESTIPHDSDVESVSSDAEGIDEWNDIKMKSAELTRRVKLEPKNIEAWQNLIAHQEDMIRLNRQGTSISHVLSEPEIRSLADVRISIYNQALAVIETPRDREKLLLGLMVEASKSWDEKKLASKWNDILKSNPSSLLLWHSHLNHAQSTFREFTHSHCVATYRQCLTILFQAKSKYQTVEMQVYVFTRLSIFLLETGFSELSLALWQAILEFHLFKPPGFSDLKEEMDALEEFWDTEVARVGESGARGWQKFHEDGGDPVEPINVDITFRINPEQCFEQFSHAEVQLGQKLKWPGRAADEIGDDPYHMVIFSDIRPWLELLPREIEIELLFRAFTVFSGLPSPSLDTIGQTRAWYNDTFLTTTLTGLRLDRELLDASKSQPWVSQKSALWNGVMTPTQLIDHAFPESSGSDTKHLEWTQRILAAFNAASHGIDFIAEYYLAFSAKYFPNVASKTAKSLLKASPASLRLYNVYAQIEARAGKVAKADSVLETALSMSHGLPHSDQVDTPVLWLSYVWNALDAGNIKEARNRIIRGSNSSRNSHDPEPAEILKTTKTLIESRKNCLSIQKPIQMVYYSILLVLLTYLQNSDILSTFDIFAEALNIIADYAKHSSVSIKLLDSVARLIVTAITNVPQKVTEQRSREPDKEMLSELLYQFKAQLLHYHVQHNATKPVVIQQNLQEALTQFPGNTILLDVWKAHEARFGLEDRLRGSLRSLPVPEEANVSRLYWNVQREIERWSSGIGTVHSAYAAFEHGTASAKGRNSRVMWTMFCLLVHEQGNAQETKKVFFRGLTQLPWAKDYIMLAFTHLRNAFTFEELRSVYNVMQEKELRLFVDLGDAFEAWDRQKEKMLQAAYV